MKWLWLIVTWCVIIIWNVTVHLDEPWFLDDSTHLTANLRHFIIPPHRQPLLTSFLLWEYTWLLSHHKLYTFDCLQFLFPPIYVECLFLDGVAVSLIESNLLNHFLLIWTHSIINIKASNLVLLLIIDDIFEFHIEIYGGPFDLRLKLILFK